MTVLNQVRRGKGSRSKKLDVGIRLMNLIRERRKYEVRTLEGYMPSTNLMWNLLTKEIEILQQDVSAYNKRRLRQEAKDNPELGALLARGECKGFTHLRVFS